MSAFQTWHRLAEEGNAEAQSKLGSMYQLGQGVEQDYAAAMTWGRKAAEQGNAEAQFGIGVLYHAGLGVEQDYMKAFTWYRKAAEQGNASAASNLGVLYDTGNGVQRDYREAMKWYRKGADRENTVAQFNIGVLYDTGRGVKQDDNEALNWYRRAAEKGHANAQFHLGLMYEAGRGVQQDYSAAADWYRKAAAQDNTRAQYSLGLMYEAGRGVERDYAEAAGYYRQAAERASPEAKFRLALVSEVIRSAQQNSPSPPTGVQHEPHGSTEISDPLPLAWSMYGAASDGAERSSQTVAVPKSFVADRPVIGSATVEWGGQLDLKIERLEPHGTGGYVFYSLTNPSDDRPSVRSIEHVFFSVHRVVDIMPPAPPFSGSPVSIRPVHAAHVIPTPSVGREQGFRFTANEKFEVRAFIPNEFQYVDQVAIRIVYGQDPTRPRADTSTAGYALFGLSKLRSR